MFNAGIISSARAAVRGEQIFSANSSAVSGNWVCPAGVSSVCVVLVGMGGASVIGSSSTGRSGAGGGALVYKNNIAVTPGASYSYSINSTATAIFGMSAGAGSPGFNGGSTPQPGGTASTAGSPDGRFNGGAGALQPSGSSPHALGGSAASYYANGVQGGGAGVDLTANTAGDYGSGGSTSSGGSALIEGNGAIRIIWGAGRSYPNNAV